MPQSPTGPATDINTKWDRAEDYGHDIIADLNNGTVGWMDWNLALDMKGGPNHAKNYCDALVWCDYQDDRDSFYLQPMFYYFAHFTKFLPPGSKRIKFDSTTSSKLLSQSMECTAFKTPDNQIVIVVQNADIQSHSYWIHVKDRGYINVKDMPSHSIQTFVISM